MTRMGMRYGTRRKRPVGGAPHWHSDATLSPSHAAGGAAVAAASPRGSSSPKACGCSTTEGVSGFSLPKLGRALGADQTAVYRHFASKDDLLLAIADRLRRGVDRELSPHDCWVETLLDVVRQLRGTYLAHPAAASLSACRTTRRPAEMRAIDLIVGAVLEAGFTGAAAARVYRAFGDFILFWSGSEATFLLTRSEPSQALRPVGVDPGLPRRQPRRSTPTSGGSARRCPSSRTTRSSRPRSSLLMDGLISQAPKPCTCQRATRCTGSGQVPRFGLNRRVSPRRSAAAAGASAGLADVAGCRPGAS